MHIVLYGLSGSGKSTLADGLATLPPFRLCKMTVTRQPRADDRPELFEYVSISNYLDLRKHQSFALDDDDGLRYYGYQWRHLQGPQKILVLFGCPQSAFAALPFFHLKVLVEGEEVRGLECRGNATVTQERTQINEDLKKRFFLNPSFRQNMDLVVKNTFFTGVNVERKIKIWTQGKGKLLFWKCQVYLAKHKSVTSAVWVAYQYFQMKTPKTCRRSLEWTQYAISLGWVHPFLGAYGSLVFGRGKPLVSYFQMMHRSLPQNHQLIYFLFQKAGFSKRQTVKNEIWEKKMLFLFHG